MKTEYFKQNSTFNKVEFISQTSDIRLQDGTVPWEGRVEIFINGEWGTVCASNSWDVNRASYFCRLLGYYSAVSVIRDPTIFGPGSGPVVLDKIKCQDYEKTSFHNCDKVYFPRRCTNPGAGVRCLQQNYDGSLSVFFFLLTIISNDQHYKRTIRCTFCIRL